MSDGDVQERGEACFGPELTGAFETVLELGTKGFHRTAPDRHAQGGVFGVVRVVGVVPEVGVLVTSQ